MKYMKKNNYLVIVFLLFMILSTVCSCGNSGKPQVDEQAIKDSIENAIKDSLVYNQVGKTKQNEVNDQIRMPSVQKIGGLFDDMVNGNSTALKDYGFIFENRQTKKFLSDYEDDETEYEMVKEVYSLRYKISVANSVKEGNMRATYVFAKGYGDPAMTIGCDTKSWEYLQAEAKASLKVLSDNYFFLNNYSFIDFQKKGVITITTESSVSW